MIFIKFTSVTPVTCRRYAPIQVASSKSSTIPIPPIGKEEKRKGREEALFIVMNEIKPLELVEQTDIDAVFKFLFSDDDFGFKTASAL